MEDSNAETQKEPTQPSPFIDKGFKHEQHQQQQQLQQHRNFRKNGASIVHKHTSQAKTDSEQPGSSNTEVANLQDHPKQRSQSGNTSSRRITEDSTEPECEVNQNSQWKATTTPKRRHGSSKTTRDDYPRKQAFSAPTTSGKSTSSTMRSASSTIGTGHREHHLRSSYSRTPHSIRPEDERSIPDTISTGNLDKSDFSQPRQDNISWNTGDSPMDTSPNKMLPLPAIRTCRQGMHNQTAKVRDLQRQPRNQGMSTEERKGRNSGTSMCQLPRKTRRSLSEMPSSSTSSSSNEAKDNHSTQKRGTSTAPEEKINHHNSRPGNQATSTTDKAAPPSTKAMSVNQSEAATTSQEHPRDSPANQNHLRGTPTNQRKTSTSPTYETSTHQEQSTKGTGVSNTSHQQPRHRSLQKRPSSMQVPGADIQRSSSEQGSQNSSRFSQRHHPDHRGGTQPATVRDIKLLHFNCQGANNKKPAIEHAVRNENFDIICQQDTRLEPSKENPSRSKFNLADFDIYHRPKSENCHVSGQQFAGIFQVKSLAQTSTSDPKRNISAYGYTLSHLQSSSTTSTP